MKLVLTGASGFVAKELIPLLIDRGIDLILISNSTEKLKQLHPSLICANYEDIDRYLVGSDGVLHLSAQNNDVDGDISSFRSSNVEMPLKLLRKAKDAGVGQFIFASSFHAISLGGPKTHYARSKAEAEEALSSESGINVSVLHMAAVYGSAFSGKLTRLNGLPAPVRSAVLTCLTALRPAVNVKRVADRIVGILNGACLPPHYLSDPAQENPVYTWGKRIMDVMFALCVFVFAGWLLVIVWILIKLDTPGPGIFCQERVGKDGEVFTCYKFRTMRQGTKQAGTHELSAASITRLGHFLRKTKLDELPQIINIARNELSLIGPRPCLPSQVELIKQRRDLGVFAVKPGISGLAQIQNIDMSDPVRLARVDALYVAQQSLILDIRIALATATGSGQGDKVNAG